MANEYCTLEDVKTYGPLGQDDSGAITETKDDDLVEQMIESYSRAIEVAPHGCGWSFYQESVVEYLRSPTKVRIDREGYLWVSTRKPTIQSVVYLKYKFAPGDDWIVADLTKLSIITLPPEEPPTAESYKIAADLGLERYRNSPLFVEVSYSGGYTSVPLPIFEAVRQLVWNEYKIRQYRPSGIVGMDETGTVVRADDWPTDIVKLFEGWKRKWT